MEQKWLVPSHCAPDSDLDVLPWGPGLPGLKGVFQSACTLCSWKQNLRVNRKHKPNSTRAQIRTTGRWGRGEALSFAGADKGLGGYSSPETQDVSGNRARGHVFSSVLAPLLLGSASRNRCLGQLSSYSFCPASASKLFLSWVRKVIAFTNTVFFTRSIVCACLVLRPNQKMLQATGLYLCLAPCHASIMLGTQQEPNEYLLINGT